MRRRDLTVIVARFADVPARKFSIPEPLLLTAIVAVAVLLAAFVFSALHYHQMWSRSQDHADLKAEVDQLRKQNEAFRIAAKQLTDRISSIEVAAQKLKIVSGLDQDGLGGVGGPSAAGDSVLQLDEQSLFRHFESLDRKSITLLDELRQLQEYYKDRNILLAATPSVMPVRGYPSDRYGMRSDPFTGERDFHPGLDISAPQGNRVVATADGTVSFSGRKVGYGKVVILDHRFGISTRYGHLARAVVDGGQKVRKGDIIGYVGQTGRATGPHVHYEVRLNGRPLDPLRFFQESE